MQLGNFFLIWRQPKGINVSPGEFEEEVSVSVRLCCVCMFTFHTIGQHAKLTQPIGIHVSPGEIAEEVSVCLCSGSEYKAEREQLACYWPVSKAETANRNSRLAW